MPIRTRHILPLLVGLALALPASAWAQGRGHARGHDKNKSAQVEGPRVIVLDGDRRYDRDGNDDRTIVVRDSRGTIVLEDGRRTIVLDDDDFRRYPIRSQRGPSFCRSGAGHPVYGIQWCLDKGFGIGRPGWWLVRDDDVYLRDRDRVIVLRGRASDADRAFWGAVVGQLLAWVD